MWVVWIEDEEVGGVERGVEGESLAVVSKRMRHYCSVKGRRDEEA